MTTEGPARRVGRPGGAHARRTLLPVLALAAVALVAGCTGPTVTDPVDPADRADPAGASPPPTAVAGGSSAAPDPTQAPVGREHRYVGTVIGGDDDEPRLCGGVVLQVHPPACEGRPVVGWDWDSVSHRSESGRRWGHYEVVGTDDGRALTLTRPVAHAAPDAVPATWMRTPCPVPAGGWVPPDPARADEVAMAAAVARAEQVDGFEASFADEVHRDLGPPGRVLSVRTRGDLAATESAVREVWGGALCVARAHGLRGRQLTTVLEEVTASDVPVLTAGVDPESETVDVLVWVATAQVQSDLDERYGDGVVVVRGLLAPVR